MAYKRILTIQDISCLGQCSTSVALPILSACGCETCILPTAILSTHTGGFGTPAVTHMDEAIPGILRHWQSQKITFDAILIGYLGSTAAIQWAKEAMETLLAPGGILVVDPVLGDGGKLYAGLDETYVREMETLCARANWILRGMEVPAGDHTISFYFHPDMYLAGRWTTTICSGLLILALIGSLVYYARKGKGSGAC